MITRLLSPFSLALFTCSLMAQNAVVPASAPASLPSASQLIQQGREALRSGKLDAAVEKFQAAIAQDEKSGEALAGLARTYLRQEKLQQAADAATRGLAAAPDYVPGHSALGEVYFRQGLLNNAEKEFVKGANAIPPDARAFLGLSEIYDALSLHAQAKKMLDRAHELDPGDPDIVREWGFTLKGAERIKVLEGYMSVPNGDEADERESLQKYIDLLKQRESNPNLRCRVANKLSSTEADLQTLLIDPRHLRGYGLKVNFNGKSSTLLLDTGAGGILINKRLAEKAGIKPLSTIKFGGIGDAGERSGYIGYADSIKIGELEFRNCLVEVSDKRFLVDEDGLIGANVFSRYLVTIDFLWHKLKLQELPKRPGEQEQTASLDADEEDGNAGPHDRYIAPEMQGYTKILRFGHDLLVPTWLGSDPVPKLFLIDTGAMTNNMSLSAARAVTGVHHDAFTEVRGVSGQVKKVYSADKVKLHFSHFEQENQDILTIDMSSISKHTGTEVSGILGFTTLRLFNIKIDYRDGLVDFIYNGEKR